MCGICGAIQLRGPSRVPLDEDVLRRMTDAMFHRGPDDDGYHLDEGIAMGVRRLSIVDVVEAISRWPTSAAPSWLSRPGYTTSRPPRGTRVRRSSVQHDL
jgi:asparagine synthetase B (glutamine-hydrolysing)